MMMAARCTTSQALTALRELSLAQPTRGHSLSVRTANIVRKGVPRDDLPCPFRLAIQMGVNQHAGETDAAVFPVQCRRWIVLDAFPRASAGGTALAQYEPPLEPPYEPPLEPPPLEACLLMKPPPLEPCVLRSRRRSSRLAHEAAAARCRACT